MLRASLSVELMGVTSKTALKLAALSAERGSVARTPILPAFVSCIPSRQLATRVMTATQPYAPQDAQEVTRVLAALEAARKNKRQAGLGVRKTTYKVESSRNGIRVDSWRLQDWDYKRPDLPTYARGLFTTVESNGVTPEIAVRGYDKFFNVGEVSATKWDKIMETTRPPYELTLKENGCIIFIAGLADDTLLVCSKHSTGDRDGKAISHSRAGEMRLEKQLANVGKTKTDLARELRRRNATAVAELCDDTFEEHILPYGPDRAGLYLHGINLNLPQFATYPTPVVQEFAHQWGFIKTDVIIMDDVGRIRAFLEETAQTGAHDNRDIEGFVVRCKRSLDPKTLPYQDWFFKFKFDEPYLMYRQWRECTKLLIADKPPRYKKHKKITEQYLAYARRRLAEDPNLGKLYNQNHGIISLRNDFLQFKNLKGAEAASLDFTETVISMPDVTGDVILCPIATIGCGKTTIAVALKKLFGWGHIQNDNIMGKNRPPKFTEAILNTLEKVPVTTGDRNNTQSRERTQIITDIKSKKPTAKLVCLHFRHDEDSRDEIWRVTRERVMARGDNHQTIRAATDQQKYFGIMEGFMRNFQPCDPTTLPDSGFDVVVDLDPVAGSRVNLETVIKKLQEYFPNLIKKVPSSEQLDTAIEEALAYKPDLERHVIPNQKNGETQDRQLVKPRPPKWKRTNNDLNYMSVTLDPRAIIEILENAFRGVEPQMASFYQQLRQTQRIQREFHVTLMHHSSSQEHPDLWKRYVTLYDAVKEKSDRLGQCEVVLQRIVFDERVMAIEVRLNNIEEEWECVNRVAHITVGTRDRMVKPKESNELLARRLDLGVTKDSVREIDLKTKPVLIGDVKGVPVP